MSHVTEFSVTMHRLAPDLKRAGLEFPDLALAHVSPDKLKALLDAFGALAPKTQYPAEPEMRIGGPHGRFLVQARNGQVRVTSWSSQQGGFDLTPNRILSMIMGMEEREDVGAPVLRGASDAGGKLSRRWRIALLALAALGANAVTAWMLMRPPPTPPPELFPEYRLVDAEGAARVLADFVGEFETGVDAGDRRLMIARDGTLRWTKLGPSQTVAEESTLTAQPAESRGHPVLVASNYGMIEMKDPITVVYFGDTYRRKMR